MERLPSESGSADTMEQCTAVAVELERLIAEHAGESPLPRAVMTIAELLKAGDMKNAKAAFEWERDKLVTKEFESIYDFLEKNLA